MLFRSEVFARRADGLSGDILFVVPLAWQAIGYLIFGGIAGALIFFYLATYSRVETVTGAIVPDLGVATIVAPRSGVLMSLTVRDGQEVAANAELATVRTEEAGVEGLSPAEGMEVAIARQDADLVVQAGAVSVAIGAQAAQLAAQREGLRAEIAQVESQIALQRDLVRSAQQDLDSVREIAQRGFISRRDLRAREEALLSRQQSLSQLTQSLASRRASLTEAERRASELAAQSRAQAAGLSASRAEIAQKAASVSGSRAYVLRAPVAGRVTALTARAGQPVDPQTQLMTIVPAGSELRAELLVPTQAIGFVNVGQEVRLAIDAFPYQRFGTVEGTVMTVATSAIAAPGANGATVSVYPVTIALENSAILAFGRHEPLVPGMTLTGRIVTDQRSLLEWLFEPFFAVVRR